MNYSCFKPIDVSEFAQINQFTEITIIKLPNYILYESMFDIALYSQKITVI